MDYSAVSGDADALHGASPWGSSSPRAERAFQPPAGDSPESPTPIRGHAYNQSQDSIPDTPYLPQPSQPNESVSGDMVVAPQPQQASVAGEQAQNNQAPATGEQETGQAAPRPGAARYHNSRQQRPVPQYKLQAKVTALERTGRKDPVIRFDVYVCSAARERSCPRR